MPLRGRTAATFQETPATGWAQSKSQSRYENHLQERGEYGQQRRGSVPQFLPRLAHERHEASDGPPHLGAKDSGDHSNHLEERSTFRRETTEATSSLSVSDQESVPSLGDHPWRWQSGFLLRRSDRGRVSSQKLGDLCASAPSLQADPMPPRMIQQSCRPRVSDRTMVGNSATRLACEFQRTERRRHDEHETKGWSQHRGPVAL